ncbi:MAG TPA: class I SAM-dependent methyltransferase [Polyangia bacterium]|nr:class I SAM-dependent methyltransferase [Polyangia bacterium]
MEGPNDPWLEIPADEYEAHMSAVGQSAILRAMFFRVYSERRPKRLAVLGCTTGSDLRLVDPEATELAFGVDLNPAYLAIARERTAALGEKVRLVEGDVLRVALPAGGLDLVHAALLLEYVDPLSLFRRVLAWLAPRGVCSIVTQQPAAEQPAVSETPYRSLRALAPRMRLRDAQQIATLARQCGLRPVGEPLRSPAGGKTLVSSLFQR